MCGLNARFRNLSSVASSGIGRTVNDNTLK